MLRHGIPDIRLFFDSDVRFLEPVHWRVDDRLAPLARGAAWARRSDAGDVADRLARQVRAGRWRRADPSGSARRARSRACSRSSSIPNADRLSLCQVDAGGGEPLEVVCGAPNVQAGKTYPFAPVGATLPGGLKLERRKIRGVESNGMLCSAKELGLGVDHAGILELETDAPPERRFSNVVPIADEQIVIDVSANRPDLLVSPRCGARAGGAVWGDGETSGDPAGSRRIGGSPKPSAHPPIRPSGTVDGVEVRLEDPEGAPAT